MQSSKKLRVLSLITWWDELLSVSVPPRSLNIPTSTSGKFGLYDKSATDFDQANISVIPDMSVPTPFSLLIISGLPMSPVIIVIIDL